MSTAIDILVTLKSGESFRLSDYNIKALDFVVSSPPIQSSYGDVEGKDGTVDYGATLGQRNISVPFQVAAYSSVDYPAIRDTLFGLMVRKESFYIQEFRMETTSNYTNYYGGNKRYLVRLESVLEPSQRDSLGSGELEFETTESPYAESPWTTLNGFPSDPTQLGFRGLPPVNISDLRYTHTGTNFRIYNGGNISVHPFDHDLVITVGSVVGSTEDLEVENVTNGSMFRVNDPVSDSKVIVLNGPTVTSNGLQFLRNTNRQFIELSPGWNDFVVRGATSATVSFDFRFYYT
jgi:hypothetical protein